MIISSCEKVINLNLDHNEKRIIVEGVVSNRAGECRVLVSETQDFNDTTKFIGVTGAQVTIEGPEGEMSLIESAKGIYTAPALVGNPGDNYRMKVVVNGKIFEASAKMPALVKLDSIYISTVRVGRDAGRFASVKYTDPAGIGNAYRFVQIRNGERLKNIYVNDDALIDGRTVNDNLLFFKEDRDDDEGLKPGDKVTIQMMNIDLPVYKYWYSLAQGSTGQNNSAHPANPVSNMEGGALGYFSAHTIQEKTMIVP